jgi:hypothetical protein
MLELQQVHNSKAHWGTHMCGSHPNVPWSCALVVHVSFFKDKRNATITTSAQLQGTLGTHMCRSHPNVSWSYALVVHVLFSKNKGNVRITTSTQL